MNQQENTHYIALYVETSSTYGRQLLRGILNFARSHVDSKWVTLVDQFDLTSRFSSLPNNIPLSGIISRSREPKVLDWIVGLNVPWVNLADCEPMISHFQSQTVRSNDEKIGQLAAEHLISLGFKNFGFAGYTNEDWSTKRCKGFRASTSQIKGSQIAMYHSSNFLTYIDNFEQEQSQIVDWLKELPKPVGIMACNDLRGKQVLDCCIQAQLNVPEEVAVIGVDNEDVVAAFCHPPLSSVIPNAAKVGFLAANQLDAQMRNEATDATTTLVEPQGIEIRQSTDIVAIDDPDISNALRFMRDNAINGITIEDVVQISQISRSTLERRMKEYLKRTPQQELRRIQLNHVRKLLLTTEVSIEEVAAKSGFEHAEYLHVIFKKEFGMTPGEFRTNNRIG